MKQKHEKEERKTWFTFDVLRMTNESRMNRCFHKHFAYQPRFKPRKKISNFPPFVTSDSQTESCILYSCILYICLFLVHINIDIVLGRYDTKQN